MELKSFRVKNRRHLDYWRSQKYPVMLVIRTSDGRIRWMDVQQYLFEQVDATQIVFSGEPFTAASLRQLRNRIVGQAATRKRPQNKV